MFKDNAVLLQLKSQLSAGSKQAQTPKNVAAPKQAAPKQAAPKQTAKPAVTKQPSRQTQDATTMVKVNNNVSVAVHGRSRQETNIDTIYEESREAIMEIAEANWGKIGTDEKIQEILVKVMMTSGVHAANRLILETSLNKLGWKLQHPSQYRKTAPLAA
jgi:hypothetical protein